MHTVDQTGACGARLVADEPYHKGALICTIDDYRLVSSPTYQTIQVGPNLHLQELGIIAYMNHSCQPNTLIDTTSLTIRAIREIAVGEDLTFFYPSTEWELDRPFVCLCGAPECIRLVAGAKYLAVDVLRKYFINQHIRELIAVSLAEQTGQTLFSVPMMGFHSNGLFQNGGAMNASAGSEGFVR